MKKIIAAGILILALGGIAFSLGNKGADLKQNTKDQAISTQGAAIVIYGSIGLGYAGIAALGFCLYALIRRRESCSRSSSRE